MPVPAGVDVRASALQRNGRVTLRWHAQHPAGGPVFYVVLRQKVGAPTVCAPRGGSLCALQGDERARTTGTTFTDRAPSGRWAYRVMVAANWLDDPNFGDVYTVGKPILVRVR